MLIHFIFALASPWVFFFFCRSISGNAMFHNFKFEHKTINQNSSVMASINDIPLPIKAHDLSYRWVAFFFILTTVISELLIDICHYNKTVFSVSFFNNFISYAWDNQWTMMSIVSHMGTFSQIFFWILFVLSIFIGPSIIFD